MKIKTSELTGVNMNQALTEGWALFDVDGRLQLQKDDERNVFATDADAIIFVALKAHAGSEYHREALELIGTLATEELI